MFCASLFAQKEKYSSKEENKYYKNLRRNFVSFRPLDTKLILSFEPEYYEIHGTELNYEPYSPDKYLTPYADSIFSILFSRNYDIWDIEVEKIGKIDKTQILKYEKRDSVEAFIYNSYEYENIYFGEPGIWIGYSENNGKDWNYYYTGIVQRQPVFIKYYSRRPLIKAIGKLEIDACLLRQLSAFSHPGPGPSYECVKDGIYLVFDINVIAKDSDGDGLTDIVEDKLYTDKFNKDTDGDGIPDNLDTNPRIYYPRTEKSKIYEAVLDHRIDWDDTKEIGKLLFNENTTYNVTDSTETIIIVTNNEDLMGIQPETYRVIFITPQDYKNKTKTYKSELNAMYFSPLFKVDNKRDTYKIHYDFNTWGSKYLIRKTEEGWMIEILSMWIS